MARDKMFDPAFQKSFTEAIHKENKIRVKWHLEHGARMRRGGASCNWDDAPDDDDDDFVPSGEEGQPLTTSETFEEGLPATRIQQLLEKAAISKKVRIPAVMKPVPVKTKRLLYKGLSHHGEGKSRYLGCRYKENPENKFFYPICSSWDYGWTYGQDHDLPCPDHGRRQIMKESFFRPNDPQLKPRD